MCAVFFVTEIVDLDIFEIDPERLVQHQRVYLTAPAPTFFRGFNTLKSLDVESKELSRAAPGRPLVPNQIHMPIELCRISLFLND